MNHEESINSVIKVKFKTSMIRSNLCDYVKGAITVPKTGTEVAPNNRNKKVIFKNCAPFTNCISEIKNMQVDILMILMQ